MIPKKIKIIIADDHPLFRKGIKYTLLTDDQFEIAGEASNGNDAISLIENFSPDIAIMDIEMPICDGITVAQRVLPKMKKLKIIFLTMHAEPSILKKAIEIGAKGYLLKDSIEDEIIEAINAVYNGRIYIDPIVSGYLLHDGDGTPMQPLLKDLTKMEYKIIKSVANNKTTHEIAEELFISERTVDRHRSNICKKLDLTGNNALIKYALANKEELMRS
ncbi:MAG: response regulator [Ignavibacteriaceae bacterium]